MDKNIFNIFDIDHDGHISFEEFRKIWLNLGIKRPNSELYSIFETIDIDKNGTIEYWELKQYMDENFDKNDIESINESFSIIDTNNDRYISFYELEHIIHKLKLDISLSSLKLCFYDNGYTIDKKISLYEFTRLVANTNTNKSVFSILGNLIEFIDQSEVNLLTRKKSQLRKKELSNDYLWIKKITPFTLLSRYRIYRLLDNMKKNIYHYNNTIINIHTPINYIYLIFSGEVKLINAYQNEISLLKSGSIICLEDIINGDKYFKKCTTTTDTILWIIPITDFLDIIKLDYRFKEKLLDLSDSMDILHSKFFLPKKFNTNKNEIDHFKNIRGFKRWYDEYPIKINSNNYDLKDYIIKPKKKPNRLHSLPKIRRKSYSKYGKTLDKIIK